MLVNFKYQIKIIKVLFKGFILLPFLLESLQAFQRGDEKHSRFFTTHKLL